MSVTDRENRVSARARLPWRTSALLAVFAAASLVFPAAAQADPETTASASASPSATPSANANPSEPAKPRPSGSANQSGQPAADVSDAGKPGDKEPGDKKPKRKKPKHKKPSKQAIERAIMMAAARQQLAMLTDDLARQTETFQAAKKKRDKIRAKIKAMQGKITEAELRLTRFVRQTYIMGAEPSVLAQIAALDSGDPTSYQQLQLTLAQVGAAQSSDLASSLNLIVKVQSQKAAAETAFAAAKAPYDLLRWNVATAQSILGIASGIPLTAATEKKITSYPVGDCSFPEAPPTPVTCEEAQINALAEVVRPTANWDHLCLGFISKAYGGAGGTIPRAIDVWNSLPLESRHTPDTVAPPGSLMFWAPNHIALSLGNNMLVSTDVLGSGRAWIVSFATIQSVWNMPYLGWSAPDFSHA